MLFHVSEEPGIERFEPRASEHAVEPAVWAIDAERLRNYLVPRECPRVTYYAISETTAADVERFLGSSTAVVAVENGWLEDVRFRRLYCYHLPPTTFECLDECAGYFVSRTPVVPERVEIFDDPLAELLRRGVEVRFVPNPLAERLEFLFGADVPSATLVAAFLKPIFRTARLDPHAVHVLETLRSAGIKTAIVSNTPWGSPAGAWREELGRHGLLDRVDATVFCMDVGWRKPHRAPFERALSLLGVYPAEALFVGDDPRLDVMGAQGAGVRPVLLAPTWTDGIADHLTIRDLRDVIGLVQGMGGAA